MALFGIRKISKDDCAN